MSEEKKEQNTQEQQEEQKKVQIDRKKVEEVLEQIRPYLRFDGGEEMSS